MSSSLTRHLIYTVTMAASLLTAGASPAGAASPAAPGTNCRPRATCFPLCAVACPTPIR